MYAKKSSINTFVAYDLYPTPFIFTITTKSCVLYACLFPPVPILDETSGGRAPSILNGELLSGPNSGLKNSRLITLTHLSPPLLLATFYDDVR